MNWEEIKECVNEWIWDNEIRTYFRLLSVEENPKMLWVAGMSGHETKLFFSPRRYFKNAKKLYDVD